jgi:hypothetical protein
MMTSPAVFPLVAGATLAAARALLGAATDCKGLAARALTR